MVLALGVLGLRPGEAIGLRVGDLDLDHQTLTVRRSVVDVGRKMVEDATKTGNHRVVPLVGTEGAFRDHLRYKYRPLDGVGPVRIPRADDLLFESRFTKEVVTSRPPRCTGSSRRGGAHRRREPDRRRPATYAAHERPGANARREVGIGRHGARG
jgi:integrase